MSATLSSCGGRAADGLDPDEGVPIESEPADDPPGWVGIDRETCEDNPLLAGCELPADYCRDNPTSPGCSSAPDPDMPSEDIPEDDLLLPRAAAANVLLADCGGCHGPALTPMQASGAINYIDDWNRLLRVGLIERCSPERSRVVLLMRRGEMPPASSGLPAVTEADIAVVENAIEFECNPQ